MKINQLMLRVGNWFRTHCLSLALAQTEVVILTKIRMDTVIPVSEGREVIQTTRVGKYTGGINRLKDEFWGSNLQNGRHGGEGHGFA